MIKDLRLRAVTAGVAAALCASSVSLAQEQRSRDLGQLEEIVVTGTKRVTDQQDTPITISTITSRQIENTFISDARALGTVAPGLVLSNPTGFNATGGGMRGTGTNIILVTQDAPVSFLVDDFVLSHVQSQFIELFDLEQVEVYRGPQGTLFGKNTTGGVISIRSRRPEMNEFSGEVQGAMGAYDGGGDIAKLRASVNLPLVENTLSARFAAIYDVDQGYYRNNKDTATFPDSVPLWQAVGIPEGTPIPADADRPVTGTGERLGGKDVFAGKGKLLWQPTDNYEAYAIYEIVRDRSDSPPGVNESAPDDLIPLLGFPGIGQTGASPFDTHISNNTNGILIRDGHRVDADGLYLTQTLGTDIGEFVSITGYREQRERLPSTYVGEAYTTLFDSTRNTERYTFQQELRYASDLDGPFNFVLGGNMFRDSFNFRSFFSVGLQALLPACLDGVSACVTEDGFVNLDTINLEDYEFQTTNQDREEYAVFWDGTYDITPQWRVSAGLRYSYDKKDFLRLVDGGGACNEFTRPQDAIPLDPDQPVDIPNNVNCADVRSQFISRAGMTPREFDQRNVPLPRENFGTDVDSSESWNRTTYRLVVDYAPTQDSMVYLSYATGFLSGGFSETCATEARCSYGPETNKNLELGFKADLFDDRLRLNSALFRTTYDNLQRAVVANYTTAAGVPGQETVTVNTGSSRVYGLDLEAVWVPTQNVRIDGNVTWLNHYYTSGVLETIRDAAPEEVPLGQFDVPFSPTWKAGLNATLDVPLPNGALSVFNVNANYQSKSETDVFNAPNSQMESRTLLGANISYMEPNDRWRVTLYGTNLTNREYRISALPVTGLFNFTQYGPPRTYGIELAVNFGD